MNFSGADFMPQIGRVSTGGVMIDMIGIEVRAMGIEGNSEDEGDRADDGELIEGDTDVPMDKLDGAEMMGDDAADEDSVANYGSKEHSGPPRGGLQVCSPVRVKVGVKDNQQPTPK